MKDEDIKDLIEKCNRSALLLGQVSGSLGAIIQKYQTFTNVSIFNDLDDLYSYLHNTIADIFYQPKEEVSKK